MQQARRREETTKTDAAVNGFIRLLTCLGVFNLNRIASSSSTTTARCLLLLVVDGERERTSDYLLCKK